MRRKPIDPPFASWLLWLLPLVLCSCSSSSSTTPKGDAVAGKAALTKYVCASCHGADLSGTTTPYAGTTAYPANLTPDTTTGLGEWNADAIKTAILTGKDDEGKSLCSTMPVFKNMSMTDAEATNIVAYLQSLTAVKKAVPASVCGSAGTAGSSGGSAGAAGK
jgi:mono/diheme cytochrome c family protein